MKPPFFILTFIFGIGTGAGGATLLQIVDLDTLRQRHEAQINKLVKINEDWYEVNQTCLKTVKEALAVSLKWEAMYRGCRKQ
jgi:hypothetical protein